MTSGHHIHPNKGEVHFILRLPLACTRDSRCTW